MEFLSENNIPCHGLTTSTLPPRLKDKGITIRDITDVFSLKFADFMKYYYYEIILRGNLASACDIVRLLIIYQHGGIYMDMDTLPYTDHAFKRLNKFIAKEKVVENESLFLFKTTCILKKLSKFNNSDNKHCNNHNNEIGIDKSKHQKIQELAELDIADFSLMDVFPLGKMYVHENLLSLGSLRRLKGIYFNNFIASHSGSKTIRITLRTMKKRYKFLEKNNCIFDYYKDNKETGYLTRILTWRTELMTKDYCVTSVLSGPGLIIEVLLGLAYELLDFDHSTEPSSVAEFMQNDQYGIALFQHNLDTPDGIYSSWRK